MKAIERSPSFSFSLNKFQLRPRVSACTKIKSPLKWTCTLEQGCNLAYTYVGPEELMATPGGILNCSRIFLQRSLKESP